MNTIKNFLNFLNDETGLELSEYAVAAALILVGLVAVFSSLGNAIGNVINNLINAIN